MLPYPRWVRFLTLATLISTILAACGGGSSATNGIPAPTSLSYSAPTISYTVGTAIAANTPSNGGGSVTSYSVSPALPVGLSLNTNNGIVSGTPSVATSTTNYTVTAINSSGSTTTSLSITVNDIAPTGLTYSDNTAVYVVGSAIAANIPSNGGGTVTTYSVTPFYPRVFLSMLLLALSVAPRL